MRDKTDYVLKQIKQAEDDQHDDEYNPPFHVSPADVSQSKKIFFLAADF